MSRCSRLSRTMTDSLSTHLRYTKNSQKTRCFPRWVFPPAPCGTCRSRRSAFGTPLGWVSGTLLLAENSLAAEDLHDLWTRHWRLPIWLPVQTLTFDLPDKDEGSTCSHKTPQTTGSGYPHRTVFICGVPHAARAVHRQEVAILPHDSADDANQDLPVLVPQETVDERVAGGLGEEQAFGGDAPVSRYVHRGRQFCQSAQRGQAENKLITLAMMEGSYELPEVVNSYAGQKYIKLKINPWWKCMWLW